MHDVPEVQDYLQLWGTGGSGNSISATVCVAFLHLHMFSSWRTMQTAEFCSHHPLTPSHLPQSLGAKLLAVKGRHDTTQLYESDILDVMVHKERESKRHLLAFSPLLTLCWGTQQTSSRSCTS